jgi:hypothetical protein
MKDLVRVQMQRDGDRPRLRGQLRLPSSPGPNGPERRGFLRLLIDMMTIIAIIIRVIWEVTAHEH